MKKEELLKIFKLKDMYENDKNNIPFSYHFSNLFLYRDSAIIYYIYEKEIVIHITIEKYGDNSKSINLPFYINEDDDMFLLKNKYFKNEMFPHLNFDKNIETDLEFLSGMIYNIFIPQHNFKLSVIEINY